MVSLQKESEWESELKELLEKQGVDIMEDGGHQIFDEQVALIIRILSTREKEIAAEVEKYALYCQKESAEQLERENVMLAYDMDSRQVAAKKILQILKH